MAPEIALDECLKLQPGSRVLDPMAGSGTVLRAAAEHGLESVGYDLDPLARLIAKVWTTPIATAALLDGAERVIEQARNLKHDEVILPWVDADAATKAYISFWFAEQQVRDLRRLAAVLFEGSDDVSDALRVCLSRIIVTKDKGASLARDVSHSRPHRVALSSDYDVLAGFYGSAKRMGSRMHSDKLKGRARVRQADARRLPSETESFDAVITSPPYLNAIDYLRGHRLSLVWLGYSVADIRALRENCIGVERGRPWISKTAMHEVVQATSWYKTLEPRNQNMVSRYAADVAQMVTQISRVLVRSGRAIFVIGNSCLRGVYVENSHILVSAAQMSGLVLEAVHSRELPTARRYLPTPERRLNEPLATRMRSEFVLTFVKP